MRDEALSAARLVLVARTDLDALFGFDSALRVVRRATALDADGVRLRNEFRDRQQLRHRFERPARVVLIKPGNDNAFPVRRKLVHCVDQTHIEELALVDTDDLRVDMDL